MYVHYTYQTWKTESSRNHLRISKYRSERTCRLTQPDEYGPRQRFIYIVCVHFYITYVCTLYNKYISRQYMYSNTCYDQAKRQNCKRPRTHTNFLKKKLTMDIIDSKYMNYIIYLNYRVILYIYISATFLQASYYHMYTFREVPKCLENFSNSNSSWYRTQLQPK